MTIVTRNVPPEREAVFQATVIELAERVGWRVYHQHDSRKQIKTRTGYRLVGDKQSAGFPDLVLVKGKRLIFAELKRDGEHPTDEQNEWLSALSEIAECSMCVSVTVWRPSDWDVIKRVLTTREPA